MDGEISVLLLYAAMTSLVIESYSVLEPSYA